MTTFYSNQDEASSRSRPPPTKRKETSTQNNTALDAIASKKRRVKSSKQEGRVSFDRDNNIDSAVGSLDSQQLVDYLAHKDRQYEPDSLVEIEKKRIPGQ